MYVFVRLSENLSAKEYSRNDVREKEKKRRLAVSFVFFSVFLFSAVYVLLFIIWHC